MNKKEKIAMYQAMLEFYESSVEFSASEWSIPYVGYIDSNMYMLFAADFLGPYIIKRIKPGSPGFLFRLICLDLMILLTEDDAI